MFPFMENNQIVGVVVQVESPTHISFIANHGANLSHGMVLGLDAGDGRAVLCIAENHTIQYHLNDSKRFFSGFSAENKLHEVARGGTDTPLYTQEVKARVLGTYIHDEKRGLKLHPDSVNRYSPMALQRVYRLDPSLAKIVLGLDPFGVLLGKMQYPFRVEVEVPMDSFGRHTLVSGVTGSGKSRLVGIISKKFAMGGGCTTIIDPHDEYSNLLAADAKMHGIFRYEITPCPWSLKKWRLPDDKEQIIIERPLVLSEKQLTPSSLCRLLPHISEQQEHEIHSVFALAASLEGSLLENIKSLLQEELLKQPLKTVKADRADKTDVLNALINKLSFRWDKATQATKITDFIYIGKKPQGWQEPTTGKISIICGDYNRSGIGKRFLAALFEQFLRTSPQANNRQLIIIEEAHHIFRIQDKSVQVALEQLLREARKFGITLLLVTQNAHDIPDDMRTQFQNFFSFRDPSVDDLKYLEEKCCGVKLYGGKSDFIMKSAECPSLIDRQNKRSNDSV